MKKLLTLILFFACFQIATTAFAQRCDFCDGHGYINKPTARPCTFCRERGYYPMKLRVDHECVECDGFGQVFKYPKDRRIDVHHRYMFRCNSCRGRGHITVREDHKHTCPNCEGRGFRLHNHWQPCPKCATTGRMLNEYKKNLTAEDLESPLQSKGDMISREMGKDPGLEALTQEDSHNQLNEVNRPDSE